MSIAFFISLIGVLSSLLAEMAAEECLPTFVDCHCESNFEPVIQLPINTTLKMDENSGSSSCVADTYPTEVCEKRNCHLIPNQNYKALFGKGENMNYNMYARSDKSSLKKNTGKKFMANYTDKVISRQRRFSNQIITALLSPNYPQEIIIRPGDDYFRKSKRSTGACQIPKLESSELICWKWPNYITCNQECIYGYGLEGSRTTRKGSMNCRNTENKWKPSAIKDCQPYLNCRAHLQSPGDLNCIQNIKEPSYCEIRCDDYDDFSETPLKKYVCDQHLELPHCAKLDDSVILIDPPS